MIYLDTRKPLHVRAKHGAAWCTATDLETQRRGGAPCPCSPSRIQNNLRRRCPPSTKLRVSAVCLRLPPVRGLAKRGESWHDNGISTNIHVGNKNLSGQRPHTTSLRNGDMKKLSWLSMREALQVFASRHIALVLVTLADYGAGAMMHQGGHDAPVIAHTKRGHVSGVHVMLGT